MEKKTKEEEEEEEKGGGGGREADATDDPTDTSAKEQEDLAKEAIKKFKSL